MDESITIYQENGYGYIFIDYISSNFFTFCIYFLQDYKELDVTRKSIKVWVCLVNKIVKKGKYGKI